MPFGIKVASAFFYLYATVGLVWGSAIGRSSLIGGRHLPDGASPRVPGERLDQGMLVLVEANDMQ